MVLRQQVLVSYFNPSISTLIESAMHGSLSTISVTEVLGTEMKLTIYVLNAI